MFNYYMRYIQKTDENGIKKYFLVRKYEFITRTHSKPRKENPRTVVLRLLGERCSNPNCLIPGGCVERKCLQIDHINGGGRKEVREMHNSYRMFNWYVRHQDEAKKNLQVLCANCNTIKEYNRRSYMRHI